MAGDRSLVTTPGPIFGAEPGHVDTPDWVADAIFYQIFPDRFAISPTLEKPSGLEPWDSEPTTFGYKGGDLIGVVEHLDYLQDLGINAIYFNPIFQSASNHRYHTHDYYKVDPLLGGDQAFDTMLAACHARGIRVVLDGVFNHCSRGFFQFNDILENGEGSPWRDWFTIHNYPTNAYNLRKKADYEAWIGLHALPKFNTDNPQVREYLMRVGEYWMRKGIDGWRLDVPTEIRSEGFWEEFRQRVRAINPEAYIVGEIWHIDTGFLSGTRFDALMNYVFGGAAMAFAGQKHVVHKLQKNHDYHPWPAIDGHTYAERIHELLGVYDWNIQRVQMNLLGSHDTARLITLLGDDVRSVELSYFLLFTFPGAPTIYYGDEIGIPGGWPDRWVRRSFPWAHEDRWNRDLRSLVSRLASLRNQMPALRSGTYQTIATSTTGYVAKRTLGNDELIFAINTGKRRIDIPVNDRLDPDALIAVGEAPTVTDNGAGSSLTLLPRSAALWRVRPHE